MEHTENVFEDRRFLNRNGYHSIASISAIVNKDTNKKAYSLYNCSLTISDCNRIIYLDIDSDDVMDINNSIYKLTNIIEVCQGMKDFLESKKEEVKQWCKAKEAEEELKDNKE